MRDEREQNIFFSSALDAFRPSVTSATLVHYFTIHTFHLVYIRLNFMNGFTTYCELVIVFLFPFYLVSLYTFCPRSERTYNNEQISDLDSATDDK